MQQDYMETSENNNSLEAYSPAELSTLKLPSNLSSVNHELEKEEGKDECNTISEKLTTLSTQLNSKMHGERYAFTGSICLVFF